MKHILILATLVISAPAIAQNAAPSAISATDNAAVAVPLATYIKAQENGDGALLLTAFTKDAMLFGADKSGDFKLTIQQYAKSFSGKPADDEAQRKRSFQILSVSNDAAVALVVLDYPKVKYADYMSLLKIKGEWKIVNKTFFAERR